MNFEREALRCLHRMSRAIARAPGLTAVCDRLLAEAIRVIPVTKASIMKYDPRDRTLRIVAARGIPQGIARSARVKVGEGISGRVFAASRPLLVRDIRAVRGVHPRRRYRGRSLIATPVTCMPLKVGNLPVGVVNMTDKRDGTPFTKRDLELLTTISNQLAAYLHLCDLADEVAVARRTDAELEMARQIQRGLLPADRPRLRGLDAAGVCLTSARVGGDYYDYFPDPGGTSAVVIADVAGHNVAAALTMANLRSALRAEAATPYLSCSAVAEQLNALVYPDLARAEQFVSLVYGRYLPETRTLRFCIAGHPPPLLYCRVRRAVAPLGGGDGLIGITQDARFSEHRVQCHLGDLLLLYTDGLVGARDRRGRSFGHLRLQRLLARMAGRSARQGLAGIMAAVRAHTGSTPLDDDITAVLIKIR
ncbi:MAG: SpoIIE family protein phosphatase [Deltaproteobacteria bacterium]|nr:SpoIIE family protein phosphatase [Deltaproteobacteria bacterium]